MKATLSREWHTYAVKAHLAQSPERPWPKLSENEINSHRYRKKDGFEARIFHLPQPILCKREDLTSIVEIYVDDKQARLYPPFKLNNIAETSGAFREVEIPEGSSQVKRYVNVSQSVPGALSTILSSKDQPFDFYQGFRMDVQSGLNPVRLMERMLELICQHTHQWWLRSTGSPFNGLLRYGAEINKDYSIRNELKHSRVTNLESTWYSAQHKQNLLGIENPMTNSLWLRVCSDLIDKQTADAGFIAFHDALASYMSEDDIRCIIHLSLCVEILGNKRRILNGLSPVSADKLIKSTDLVSDDMRRTLKNLFIDRGHVAHGREPPVRKQNREEMLEEYIEATRALLSGYLNSLEPGVWPSASQMKVRRRTKGHKKS